MASRYRQQAKPVSGRYHTFSGGVQVSTSNYSSFIKNKECWDEIGNRDEAHNLTIKDLDCYGFTGITGTSSSGNNAGSFFENECFGNLATICASHLPVSLPSIGADTTKLLARTNPSRNYVSIPTLIQDLVDIPKMIDDWAKLLTDKARGGAKLGVKTIANQHLAFSFGWLPLIKDIHDLLDMQNQVLKRKEELQRLYNVGGLKRRLKLGRYSATKDTTGLIVTSYPGGIVQGNLRQTTFVERWGTVRWLPSGILKVHPGERELYHQAQRLMAGLSVESMAEGIWDVIPWTWVIDWFADIGEFSQINSNTIKAFSYRPCIMTKTTTYSTFTPTFRSSGIGGGFGTISFTTKERSHDAIPTPATAVFPHLDARRLSILGSLSVQKLK
jgi:hypothetical protein